MTDLPSEEYLLQQEIEKLRHDLTRYMDIASKEATEVSKLRVVLRYIEKQQSPHGTMTIREASDIARKALRDTESGYMGDGTDPPCTHPKLQWGDHFGLPRKCPDCGAQL